MWEKLGREWEMKLVRIDRRGIQAAPPHAEEADSLDTRMALVMHRAAFLAQ